MSEKVTKKTLVIAGIPSNKKVVKFKDAKDNGLEDVWYKTSSKVQELDLSKYGVIAGATVEVSFDEQEDMQIVFLKATQSKPATEEPKKEAPKETAKETAQETKAEDGEVVTWTVEAVAKNKEVIKFVEDSQNWRKVSDEVKALDYAQVGIKKGNVATLTLVDDIITAISIATTENNETESKSSYSGSSKSNMDGQSAVKSVAEIVKALVDKGVIASVGDADSALRQLASTAKELIVK